MCMFFFNHFLPLSGVVLIKHRVYPEAAYNLKWDKEGVLGTTDLWLVYLWDLYSLFFSPSPFSVLGEIVVNEVNFVRKCIATDTSQYDLWGKLVCTNFKISFITDDPMPLQVCYCSHYYNVTTDAIDRMFVFSLNPYLKLI